MGSRFSAPIGAFKTRSTRLFRLPTAAIGPWELRTSSTSSLQPVAVPWSWRPILQIRPRQRLFDFAEERLGPVDILINNATGFVQDTFAAATIDMHGRTMQPVTLATWSQQFTIDAQAPALLIAELAWRHRKRGGRWGRIIGLTSGTELGFPSEVSYGAAKAAQVSYTISAAVELAPLGITANMVQPGVTDTGWVTDAVLQSVATSDRLFSVGYSASGGRSGSCLSRVRRRVPRDWERNPSCGEGDLNVENRTRLLYSKFKVDFPTFQTPNFRLVKMPNLKVHDDLVGFANIDPDKRRRLLASMNAELRPPSPLGAAAPIICSARNRRRRVACRDESLWLSSRISKVASLYAHDQWISQAGTAMATIALAFADEQIPEP